MKTIIYASVVHTRNRSELTSTVQGYILGQEMLCVPRVLTFQAYARAMHTVRHTVSTGSIHCYPTLLG